MNIPAVYLIPSALDPLSIETIPTYIVEAVKSCQVIFAENDRTVRRFLKSIDKNIVIDDFEWFTIHKAETVQLNIFSQKIKEGKNIAIVSEAGCPGIADPGQILVEKAHRLNAIVKPLVGPSAILLSLMASGLNGQQFTFNGYLPIESSERINKLKSLEEESLKRNCTQLFIETPYRNNAMFDSIMKACKDATKICIAADITAKNEFIKTFPVSEWKKNKPDLHKRPAMFLLYAG